MTEKVNPKSFTIHGLGHLNITRYGVSFNKKDLNDIIRQAAGMDEFSETEYPGVIAEITIKVRIVKPYLNIDNEPLAKVTEAGGAA